ncbi:MAG: hypothetical protein HZB56_16505 [Deltaproteobacteria bacterium]|nr:hypothetical protein [Deltaproteobacteria bacterium]
MSNMTHLERGTARRLLAGELTAEQARRIADHLDGACERCEALLAEETCGLDGPVDRALLALGPAAGKPGNDLEWARIRRQLGIRRRGWLVGLAAAAAVMLVAGVSLRIFQHDPGPWDGVKGSAGAPVTARLRFSVVLPGAEPSLARGASGLTIPEEASLLFRVEASGPADLALLRVDGGELVWQGRATRAGAIDVEEQGRPAAYPLRGLRGRQRFALVAAPSLGPARLEAARAALASGAVPEGPEPLSLDVVEVTVR